MFATIRLASGQTSGSDLKPQKCDKIRKRTLEKKVDSIKNLFA